MIPVKKIKVIITGASGMVGHGILLECLDHDGVEAVLSIGRNTLGFAHPKLKEIVHQDFSSFANIQNDLKGYDACFYSMGISSVGLNEAQYKHYTYDFALSLATVLLDVNPQMTFNYVSGVGTDSSENGRVMWARVKGKTENDLLSIGFKQAYMFRPGMIIPLKGIKSRTKSYQFLYDHLMWLVRSIKLLAPNSVVDTTQTGLAMIHSALKGYTKSVLEPKDILCRANDDS